ncbi:MAG: helix-turn-helix transcriptional regulator [Eubacteriales bacterium]
MKNNIKELRKARGLRQEDMAKLLGVSRQTIVAMENDKYDPTLELAIKTARLLEQPVEEIFFLDEESIKIEN